MCDAFSQTCDANAENVASRRPDNFVSMSDASVQTMAVETSTAWVQTNKHNVEDEIVDLTHETYRLREILFRRGIPF